MRTLYTAIVFFGFNFRIDKKCALNYLVQILIAVSLHVMELKIGRVASLVHVYTYRTLYT